MATRFAYKVPSVRSRSLKVAQNYTGLPKALKEAVFSRDNWRCRWCGTTNAYGYDAHHIQYRRGYSYDVLENLITVCRKCHDFVHNSYEIPKGEAQEILSLLVSAEGGGLTGLAVWREKRAGDEAETDVHLDCVPGPVGRLIGKEEPREVGSTPS
jgi:hypothetical protein